jgi:small-conductance mechanosensitive channel
MFEKFDQQLAADWDALVAMLPRIGIALLLVAVGYVVGRVLSWALDRVLTRGGLAAAHRQFFRQLTVVLTVLVAVALGLQLVGLGNLATGMLAGGGMTAVVLAFAFRGIGENLLAGLFLAFSRPFDVGHLVRSGEHEGVVRSIAMRYTHVRTADGRDIYIPNAQIFNEPLVNYTRDGLLRASYTFGIDWGDDASAARELLLTKVSGIAGVLDAPGPSVWISDLAANTVDLTIFFWLNVIDADRQAGVVKSDVLDACRRALIDNGYTVSSNVSTAVSLSVPEGIWLHPEKCPSAADSAG